jgi:hypothetical protein
MYGEDRREFDWKEVAKVLRMNRAVNRLTFWQEIKRSRSKIIEDQAPAIVIHDTSDSYTRKFGKSRASR